jgi:hypothetical protein
MAAYEAAVTMLCFAFGAMVLGGLAPTFGATFLLAAAYTIALLSLARLDELRGNLAGLFLLGFILFAVAAAAGLIGHNTVRWVLRRRRRKLEMRSTSHRTPVRWPKDKIPGAGKPNPTDAG